MQADEVAKEHSEKLRDELSILEARQKEEQGKVDALERRIWELRNQILAEKLRQENPWLSPKTSSDKQS